MKRLKTICLTMIALVSLLLLSGCGYHAVPSQYDLKLKTKANELSCENGGNLVTLEITIDSRRYQDLTSDNNIFLSYHLSDSNGDVILQDGIRTSLIPIKARGIKKETLEILAPLEAGSYIVEADLVEEGVTWFSAQGMETLKIPLSVENTTIPDYSDIILTTDVVSITGSHIPVDLVIAVNSEATANSTAAANSDAAVNSTPAVNADVTVNSTVTSCSTTAVNSADTRSPITITIQNDSGIALCGSGPEATQLSYLMKDTAGTILAEGERIRLPENLASGQSIELAFTPQTEFFNKAGDYIIEVDLLREGVAWFKDLGVKPVQIPVTIK